MCLVQELAGIADEVNVVGLRRVVGHFSVFSRVLRQVVSEITEGGFQVDLLPNILPPCGVPMEDVNVGNLPRFNLGSNVVKSIRMIRSSYSPRGNSRTVICLSRLMLSNAQLMSVCSYVARQIASSLIGA